MKAADVVGLWPSAVKRALARSHRCSYLFKPFVVARCPKLHRVVPRTRRLKPDRDLAHLIDRAPVSDS
ncbi:hypothetical protein CH256_05365 [Rhodococcus sp. 05-2254-6]|nr:hypothetical protein A2J04_14445 [Rhodococcus sp. EPR-279]KZF04337.1 hypothetical protein A2J02_03695 [Rhodococcus sp. EPR-147]OZE40334.1 hypothetical protein CH256_05365 [Rhodococcus sp. 05-2254-6]